MSSSTDEATGDEGGQQSAAAPVEASLVRPFLNRIAPFRLPLPGFDDAPDAVATEPEAAGVRSYAMTSGRSEGTVHLEIETMLQLTARGALALPGLQFERSSIAWLCKHEILSVAELSARLHLPLGVVRVVASDLIVDGQLEAFLPSFGVAEDVDLISRLIEGVRAL